MTEKAGGLSRMIVIEGAQVYLAPDQRAILIALLQEALNAVGVDAEGETPARAAHREELDALLTKFRCSRIVRREYPPGFWKGKGGRPRKVRP